MAVSASPLLLKPLDNQGPTGRRIGYARVSTEEQNLNAQLDALTASGCDLVFQDLGVSGAAKKRPGLDKALDALGKGDTLVVWRLDRLGRSLPHLVSIIEQFGQRGIEFQSLTEAIDTHSAGGRLLFHIMAAMAEFERSLISERTRAGMRAAKARGQRLGRPKRLTPEQVHFAKYAMGADGISISALARQLHVHRDTLSRSIRDTF